MPSANEARAPARRADVDALRILALSLLICYHTLLVYSVDNWRLNSEYAGPWADYLIAVLTPWRMSLVFFIGGIAARFMLDKMKPAAFVRDRAGKLLTAFVFAVIVIVPFQRYVRLDEAHMPRGGYFDYLLHQSMSVVRSDGLWLPDFAHAWFLPFLFTYSVAALAFIKGAPRIALALQRLIERAPLWSIIAATMLWFAFLERWVLPQRPMTGILTDDLSGHLKFAPVFALGVLLAKSESFHVKALGARRRVWIVAGALLAISLVALWANGVEPHAYSLTKITRGFYGGVMIFAVYIFAGVALDRPSKLLSYGTDAVLPVYLMHQTVLVVVGDKIVGRHWPPPLELAALLGATALIPLAIYHVFVRETPWLRVLFGLRPHLRPERTSMAEKQPLAAPPRAPARHEEVAVLIAAYNAEATLERAVRSALTQPDVAEVCIIDDGSSDGTLSLARSLAAEDSRVIVVAQGVNRGPAAARNAGVAATRSPWITILDADDYMLPGRIGALLNRVGGADFIGDVLVRTPLGVDPPDFKTDSALHVLNFEAFVEGNLGLDKGPLDLGFVKPLMRRDFLNRHALRYQEHMRLGEDYELYARALALGADFVLTGATGYISVERPGSLSRKHSEDDLLHLRDCDDGIARIRPFTAAERRALARHRTSVDCRLQWRRLITAVKARDFGAAVSTFHTPAAAVYLATRLGEQAWLRSLALFRAPLREATS